jgi:hypothetical protein
MCMCVPNTAGLEPGSLRVKLLKLGRANMEGLWENPLPAWLAAVFYSTMLRGLADKSVDYSWRTTLRSELLMLSCPPLS